MKPSQWIITAINISQTCSATKFPNCIPMLIGFSLFRTLRWIADNVPTRSSIRPCYRIWRLDSRSRFSVPWAICWIRNYKICIKFNPYELTCCCCPGLPYSSISWIMTGLVRCSPSLGDDKLRRSRGFWIVSLRKSWARRSCLGIGCTRAISYVACSSKMYRNDRYNENFCKNWTSFHRPGTLLGSGSSSSVYWSGSNRL